MRRASMNSEKWPASKTPNSGEFAAGVAVLDPLKVPVTGTPRAPGPVTLL